MNSHKTSFHGVRELVAQFEKLMFSLQRHGAVDWTHIKIKQNAINTTDFRKQRYSSNIHAVLFFINQLMINNQHLQFYRNLSAIIYYSIHTGVARLC